MIKVYKSFDQATLDLEYNAFPAAAGFDREGEYTFGSAQALASQERIADIVYDQPSGSKLDLYRRKRHPIICLDSRRLLARVIKK